MTSQKQKPVNMLAARKFLRRIETARNYVYMWECSLEDKEGALAETIGGLDLMLEDIYADAFGLFKSVQGVCNE